MYVMLHIGIYTYMNVYLYKYILLILEQHGFELRDRHRKTNTA